MCNYATKTDLKTATGVDTSKFVEKVDLANLKSNVDKLDIDKLKNVTTNLSNLKSKVGKIEDKIPDISNLATKTTLNANINELLLVFSLLLKIKYLVSVI